MGYELTARLGRGGMGLVDLAKAPDGRPVALKRLALHGSSQEMARARQRIRREAEVLAHLDHPGIVELIEVVDDGDDVILVMPYLPGGTLSDQVRAHGPLPAAHVLALADALLDALAAAHRQGVVHRDIKPANILFDHQGRPCITDFGTAVLRDATPGLTATGMVIGTPEYMAPEQARGLPAGPASDVFSLGATLRYAATGMPPFGRGDPAIVIQRAAKGRVDPWPPATDRALKRCLAPLLRRDPAKRPSAAAAAGGVAGTEVIARTNPRRRAAVAVLAAIAALAVIGAVVAGFATIGSRSDHSAVASPDDTAPASTETSTSPCHDLPYQPCGAPAAPFTNGLACTADHADYDKDPTDGCEAAPDSQDGAALVRSISANLVPSDDIDRYPMHVVDQFQLLCDGMLEVTLAAPRGASMRLDVLDGASVLGTTVSSDAQPSAVSIEEPSCLGDDTADLTARVSWVGDRRTAQPYTLSRSGSF